MDLEEGGPGDPERAGQEGWTNRLPATRFPLGLLATIRAFTTPATALRCPDGDSDGDVALFLSV